MRLDHLLSKENRVFVLSPGWVLVSTWLVASFCFQVKTGTAYTSCVVCVVLGVDETRTFCGLSALLVVKGFAE